MRLNERAITKAQVQGEFHGVDAVKIHGGRYRKELLVDGLDLVVIYERRRDTYHVVTVYVR